MPNAAKFGPTDISALATIGGVAVSNLATINGLDIVTGSAGPAYPISDTDNTGVWTTTPLWSKIDDVPGSGDADFVSSDATATSTEPFTCRLTALTDPVSSTGHVLAIRASKQSASGANYDVVCELRQGYVSEASQGTLIASVTATALTDATPTTASHTLTAGEADSITDYTSLYARCYGAKNGGGGNNGVIVYSIEFTIP